MYGERLLSGEQQSGIDDSDVDSRHPSPALPVEGERTKTVYFSYYVPLRRVFVV